MSGEFFKETPVGNSRKNTKSELASKKCTVKALFFNVVLIATRLQMALSRLVSLISKALNPIAMHFFASYPSPPLTFNYPFPRISVTLALFSVIARTSAVTII